jgi:hypothetical protein
MRRYGKRDGNQTEIINALRFRGCSVLDMADLGNGRPDLLVGYRHRVNRLIEVKMPGEDCTPDQKDWFSSWKGESVMIVQSIDEALLIMGIK